MKFLYGIAAFAFLMLSVVGFSATSTDVHAAECSVAPANEIVVGKGANLAVNGNQVTASFQGKG
jgi:hypothetical protein